MYTDIIKDSLSGINHKINYDYLSNEENRIGLVDILSTISNHISESGQIIKLSFDIVNKHNKVYLLFKFSDLKGKMCKGAIEIESDLITELNNLVDIIINGNKRIECINERLEEIQTKHGIVLKFRYRIGFGESIQVAYWDYSIIEIRLSMRAMKNILSHTEDEIDSIIDETLKYKAWPDNIPQLLAELNDSELNKRFDARFGDESIPEILCRNMLSKEDILRIIKQNSSLGGSQKLKSYYLVDSPFGIFIALLVWNIDYKERHIDVEILDEKVLDIDNRRFVSEYSLFSRIEKVVMDGIQDITDIFQN